MGVALPDPSPGCSSGAHSRLVPHRILEITSGRIRAVEQVAGAAKPAAALLRVAGNTRRA
jgi:hypothetical protein